MLLYENIHLLCSNTTSAYFPITARTAVSSPPAYLTNRATGWLVRHERRRRSTNVSAPDLTLHSRCQVPEAQRAVPRAGQSKLAIGGDHHVAHKVRVSSQSTLGDAVVRLISGQLPHDDGLICKSKQILYTLIRLSATTITSSSDPAVCFERQPCGFSNFVNIYFKRTVRDFISRRRS